MQLYWYLCQPESMITRGITVSFRFFKRGTLAETHTRCVSSLSKFSNNVDVDKLEHPGNKLMQPKNS